MVIETELHFKRKKFETNAITTPELFTVFLTNIIRIHICSKELHQIQKANVIASLSVWV